MYRREITFFMPVTDRDVVIADYAVASYQKLRDLPIRFTLLIYPNCLSPELKMRHFPRWQKFGYVKIANTEHKDAPVRPSPWQEEALADAERYHGGGVRLGRKAFKWEGPWERHDTVFDRELRKLNSQYVVTVDADFEILNPDFVSFIIGRMEQDPNLKVMSSDYSPTRVYHDDVARYDSDEFGPRRRLLWERYHTWFCVYKREALEIDETHQQRDQIDDRTGDFLIWDTSSFLQQRLRDERVYEMASATGFEKSFIHYGQFSKNRTIGYKNVWLYRLLKIAPKVPIIQQVVPYDERRLRFLYRVDRRVSYLLATRLLPRVFNEKERLRALYDEARRG